MLTRVLKQLLRIANTSAQLSWGQSTEVIPGVWIETEKNVLKCSINEKPAKTLSCFLCVVLQNLEDIRRSLKENPPPSAFTFKTILVTHLYK